MKEFWKIEEWFDHTWLDVTPQTFDTKEEAEAYMKKLPKYQLYPMRIQKYILEA